MALFYYLNRTRSFDIEKDCAEACKRIHFGRPINQVNLKAGLLVVCNLTRETILS